MTFKLRGVAAATTAALMLSFGSNAFADSTFDLVQALVNKGILTEEEALPLLKGRENDIKAADTKVAKKAKIGISDAVDNATLYGDVRVRAEYREGEDDQPTSVKQERTRTRYKITMGVKTEASDFYGDLAFAMGSGGRSDNSTFGAVNGANNKDALLVKRAMIGWHTFDWLDLEAGRITNPLYTTQMVWDSDLTVEGLAEKANFKVGDTDVFLTAFQAQYEGDRRKNDPGVNSATSGTNELLAFQGGGKFKITDNISAKAAITYYTYTNNDIAGVFVPAVGNGAGSGTNPLATNDLKIIEIPAEIGFKFDSASNLSYKVFGDYALNLDGDKRRDRAIASTLSNAANDTALRAAGNDDTAWLVGLGIDSKQDKLPKKGDWNAKLWYQDVGIYSLDPNTPDSDFFDSRVNMKGVVFKGEYALRDNVFVNFSAGKAKRKDKNVSAAGLSTVTGNTAGDIGVNIDDYELYQMDLTYKF